MPQVTVAKAYPSSCISLARYAEITETNECWFWGVNDSNPLTGACDHIWTEIERKRIARYLAEAQEEIEQVVGYPLCPRWFLAESQPYAFPVHTRWGKVIEGGFQNSSAILVGAAINYATDPAVIGPIATTVTDEDEIVVYYPGSDRPIEPESVTIAGGFVTITIPWCRMIKPENFNNPDTGWDYNDATNFLSTVDVYRVYNDDSIQAGLIFPHLDTGGECGCDCEWCCGTCGEYAANACIYVRNKEIGTVDVLSASYANSLWTAVCPTCYCSDPEYIRLNYKAGLEVMTPQVEDAVIRLAHSKMPSPPCGCDTINEMWKRDRNIPEVLDAKRLDCPFGISDGAWWAWKQALAIRLQRGMAFA